MHFQKKSLMCAKTHTISRIAKNGLPKRSDFPPKRVYFALEMAENARKMAGNSRNPGSENRSNRTLKIAGKLGWDKDDLPHLQGK
jgi:hypothetical protein